MTEFLAALFKMYPQHFAMAVLGLVTGLRPSSLRPLRRCGDTPDVRWDKAVLEIRRSQTIGERAMKTTKTKRHQTISLPPTLLELLARHVCTQLTTPEMLASELLFPSIDGGFRAASVLNKPFKVVAEEIGLGKNSRSAALGSPTLPIQPLGGPPIAVSPYSWHGTPRSTRAHGCGRGDSHVERWLLELEVRRVFECSLLRSNPRGRRPSYRQSL